MASPGKKRLREKVTNGLFAKTGDQLQLPFTVPKAVAQAWVAWKPNLLQGWPEMRPQPSWGDRRAPRDNTAKSCFSQASLPPLGRNNSSYDYMPSVFTGSPGSVLRRKLVYRGSQVVNAEDQLVFSAFFLIFPVVSTVAHCEAQLLSPCDRSPVGRRGRNCRKSRVFWCSWDTGWAHSTDTTSTRPVPYLEAGMLPMLKEAFPRKDLDSCFNTLPCSYYFWRLSKEWSMCMWLQLKFSKSN